MAIEDQIRTLERFNEKVGQLRSHRFVEECKGGGAIVEWRRGLGWDGCHIGPEEKTIDATVLKLRFFIQNNESTSLSNMARLYSGLDIGAQISGQFFEIRDSVNFYLDSPSNLSISEAGPMTHRDIFDLFVYGDIAHANDKIKEEEYRAISQTAFFPMFQDDFTKTVQLLIMALSEAQQVNSVAIDQLRSCSAMP